jgi:hypothetical protein
MDVDGTLAAALQNTIYEGDPEEQGVVWPRVAEIGLLGGLGCGRWLTECAIEEVCAICPAIPAIPHTLVLQLNTSLGWVSWSRLTCAEWVDEQGHPLTFAAATQNTHRPFFTPSMQMERTSTYEFVVLQATTNSVPFYESLGFVRVGAVARYNVAQKDVGPPPTEPEPYNFNKTYWPAVPPLASRAAHPVFDRARCFMRCGAVLVACLPNAVQLCTALIRHAL